MLVFTNRVVDVSATDESAFSPKFTPGKTVLGMAEVARRPRPGKGARWSLTGVQAAVSDGAARAALVQVFEGKRPVLVHIHGNTMPPADCFERCARFEELFGVAVAAFSWPSEGLKPNGKPSKARADQALAADDPRTLASIIVANRRKAWVSGVIGRYKRPMKNSKQSAEALARFLTLVGISRTQARSAQPFPIAAHSLGAYCLEMLFAKGMEPALPRARNIALLAACVRKEKHTKWVSRLPRSGILMVTTNVTDGVLLGAMLSTFPPQEKLGGARPIGPLVGDPGTRYVDFSQRAFGDHEYFIAERNQTLDQDLLKVFTRVFSSGEDIPAGWDSCDVYGGCCDAALHVCDVSQSP